MNESKGCFSCCGCLGCGCILVILAIIIPIAWGGYWLHTNGRTVIGDLGEKTIVELSKQAFEPESANEIASVTKILRDDFVASKIGYVESGNYVYESFSDEKLQGQIIFSVIYRRLTGKLKDGKTPEYIDAEGAEAVRTIMYALSQGKIDGKSAKSKVTSIMEDKNNIPSKNSFDTNKVKKDISAEDWKKVVESLKLYVKEQKLETPAKNITPDSLAKDEFIKFLNNWPRIKK